MKKNATTRELEKNLDQVKQLETHVRRLIARSRTCVRIRGPVDEAAIKRIVVGAKA